ncbi:site-specific integrase [candidate division NPL-UPA2 bacterium]|nr:site-specific integrase [candidate division NPL-UPA2 bacterium]
MSTLSGHIRKKKEGVWELRIELPLAPDGKRKTKYATFKGSERGAKKELSRLQNHYASHKNLIATNDTVADILNTWIGEAKIKGEIRHNTLERYEAIIRNHLIPNFGSIKLNKLEPQHIRKYYILAAESGNLVKAKKQLSTSTITQHHVVLKNALDIAVTDKIISHNPAQGLRPKYKATCFSKTPLTATDLNKLLERIKDSVIFLPTYIAAHTGMRLSEVLGLKWADINTKDNYIQIRQALHWKKDGTWYLDKPKSRKSSRVIDIEKEDITVLENYRVEQLQTPSEAFGLVCVKTDGSPMKTSTVASRFRRFAGLLGLNASFHTLRHTHATLLLGAGIPIPIVSERLGHDKSAFTMDRYIHFLPSMQKEASKTFKDLLDE